ncbi:MAG: hypothetical protein KDH09_14360 [Chrysiogenetes bacterium]|nr:hypothetical protein [Chrysiogenetes bacterium]
MQTATSIQPDKFESIADLIHSDLCLSPHVPAGQVVDLFNEHSLLDAVAVEYEDRVGLVTRGRFMSRLRGKFGYALFEKRPVAEHVEFDCLVVESRTEPVEVISLATRRPAHRIYDDIIVLTEGAYRGLVSMRMLMAHSKDLLATSFAEVSALEEKARRLEEINRLQQEFVANMTHELRTPLNTIIGISRLALKDPELSAHRQRDLEVMLRRGMDLLGIVNDMLDLYKIESGEMTPVIEEFDLHELLEDLAGSFAYLLENRPVELRSDFGGAPRMLSTDPVMLKRVLTNLLSNAVKFTEEGSVSLIASAHNGHVLIEVRDTGMGIKREDRERLFKKFSQLEAAATKRHGGTGLGLAIVQQLSEMLGGSVRLESEYGQGSSFTLTLPR